MNKTENDERQTERAYQTIEPATFAYDYFAKNLSQRYRPNMTKQPSLKLISKESEKSSESERSMLSEPEAEDSLSNYTMYS